jgi:pimeloyl-ACP methyl ester carboxylesterase
MSEPFRQGRFEDLPQRPRVPHVYEECEQLTVSVPSRDFGVMNAHVRALGDGPPLLLVHGFMTTSYSWRYALAPLSKHFRCYAPDLPGAGRSDKPLAPPYTPAALARWLIDLQRELGIYGCPVIGNSMGGYITLHGALDEPASISRLLVLHAPGIPENRLRAAKLVFKVPGTRHLLHRLVRRSPLRWVHKNVHYYDESLKSLEEAHEYGDPLSTYEGRQAFFKYLTETMNIDHMHAFGDELRAARATPFPIPLLLMYARRDPMVPPRFGHEYKRLIPSAELVWLDAASHFAHVDAVDAFAEPALRFLRTP